MTRCVSLDAGPGASPFDHADLSDEKNLFTLRLVKLV